MTVEPGQAEVMTMDAGRDEVTGTFQYSGPM